MRRESHMSAVIPKEKSNPAGYSVASKLPYLAILVALLCVLAIEFKMLRIVSPVLPFHTINLSPRNSDGVARKPTDRFKPFKPIDDHRQVNLEIRTNRLVVLKCVNPGPIPEHQRQTYISNVNSVKHPQFIRVLDAFENNNRLCVVENYLGAETLLQKLERSTSPPTEDEVIDVIAQVALALRYLHNEQKLVHGGISLENILTTEDQRSEGDHLVVSLGSISMCSSDSLPPSPISPDSCYAAPELWHDEKNILKFTPATDIWALGCLVHRMCTKMELPFAPIEESLGRLPRLIRFTDPYDLPSKLYSSSLQELVSQLLHKYPSRRPRAEDICEHPLIKPTADFLATVEPGKPVKKVPSERHRQSSAKSVRREAERGGGRRPASNLETAKLEEVDLISSLTPPDDEGEESKDKPRKDSVFDRLAARGRRETAMLGKANKRLDIKTVLTEGDASKLTEFLKSSVNVNEIISLGAGEQEVAGTALHHVAESGRADLATCLLNAKAKVDSKNNVGETPLLMACFKCHLNMVQLLCKAGAAVNKVFAVRNAELSTPLHVAVACGHIAVVKYLLDQAKADSNIRNSNGQTPLHIAAKYGDTDAMKMLIKHGADVNATDEVNHATPLHRAAAYDRIDAAKFLLRKGGQVEATTMQGKTPLHWAAENNNDCVGLLLLDYGADAEARVDSESTSKGETALHIASSLGHLRFLRVILDRGANVNSLDSGGRTPLLWACQRGNYEASLELINRGANVNVLASLEEHECSALHLACGSGNEQLVELLLLKKANPTAQTTLGRTAAHWASEAGTTACLRQLLMKSHRLVKMKDDEYEATPLFDACWFGHVTSARLLLEKGANVNEKASYKITPLHAASEGGSVETIKVLIENGGKLNALDEDKETPLHRAVTFGQKEAVEALVEAGASLTAKTIYGLNPLGLAEKYSEDARKSEKPNYWSEIADFFKGTNGNQNSEPENVMKISV